MPYRPGAPLDALARRSRPLKDSHGAAAFRAALAPAPGRPGWPDGPGWHGFPANGSYDDAVAWVGIAVAGAVEYIHSRGVVHRDIKPANIYVTARDGPLLFDFGFARSLGAGDALPGGTPAYMAPEQLRAFLDPRGWAEVGPPADTYALGVTLLELLHGEPPEIPAGSRPGARAVEGLLAAREDPGWPARVTAGIAPALAGVVRRCVAPAPEERYAGPGDVARELSRLLPRPPARLPAPARDSHGPWRRHTRASAGYARRAHRSRPGGR
jgi:serine/threonine protein kinase